MIEKSPGLYYKRIVGIICMWWWNGKSVNVASDYTVISKSSGVFSASWVYCSPRHI